MASLFKTATLHNIDFVNRMQPTKLTNSPFDHSGTKNYLSGFKKYIPGFKKYSPFLSQNDKR
jgi:hypothetical protein